MDGQTTCSLTEAQLRVLRKAAELETTRTSALAEALCLSPATANTHWEAILGRLRVHCRFAAVLAAHRSGVLPPRGA